MEHVIMVLALFDGPTRQEVDEVASLVKWVVFVGFVPCGHLDSVIRLEFFQIGPYFLELFSHEFGPFFAVNI